MGLDKTETSFHAEHFTQSNSKEVPSLRKYYKAAHNFRKQQIRNLYIFYLRLSRTLATGASAGLLQSIHHGNRCYQGK